MSEVFSEIQTAHAELTREAKILAGDLRDLPQRATTYHHLYRDSGGNHIFPLIAAHGALWAKGYFQFGMKLGRVLSLQYGVRSEKRRQQLEALEQFANAFREINQLVCVDTYRNYHLTKRFGEDSRLLEVMSPELLSRMPESIGRERIGLSFRIANEKPFSKHYASTNRRQSCDRESRKQLRNSIGQFSSPSPSERLFASLISPMSAGFVTAISRTKRSEFGTD